MPKTRILFISTYSLTKSTKEEDTIQEYLQKSKYQNSFTLETCHAQSADDIICALACCPHIIHFSCHGTAERGIHILNESGSSIPLNGSDIWRLLCLYSEYLECVVFNVCHSEELVRFLNAQGVKYIIGMEGIVESDYAISFSRYFYENLFNSSNKYRSYSRAFRTAQLHAKIPQTHSTRQQPEVVNLSKRNMPIILTPRSMNPPVTMPVPTSTAPAPAPTTVVSVSPTPVPGPVPIPPTPIPRRIWTGIMALLLIIMVGFLCIYPYIPNIPKISNWWNEGHIGPDATDNSVLIDQISTGDEKAIKTAESRLKTDDPQLKNDLEKLASGSVYAQNILGADAYRKEQYSDAFRWYKMSADQGDAEGQAWLGNCYYFGYGTSVNYNEAFKWYERSMADGQNNSEGQNGLGNCYLHGHGVEQDRKTAFAYFEKSAEQKNPNGQNGLGWCYEHGYGCKQDLEKARYYYELSADQGNPDAPVRLENLLKAHPELKSGTA